MFRFRGVATGVALAAMLATGVGSAQASPQILCGVRTVTVPESSSLVHAGTAYSGDRVTITPRANQIWAGVWFTGWNGPAGWSSLAPSGQGYPRPGVNQYSLIAFGNGAWRYAGGQVGYTQSPYASGNIYLRVNDNVVGNGSGSFVADVKVCHTQY